jgi:hypothetical protein
MCAFKAFDRSASGGDARIEEIEDATVDLDYDNVNLWDQVPTSLEAAGVR